MEKNVNPYISRTSNVIALSLMLVNNLGDHSTKCRHLAECSCPNSQNCCIYNASDLFKNKHDPKIKKITGLSAVLAKSPSQVTGCHLHECQKALDSVQRHGTHPSTIPDCSKHSHCGTSITIRKGSTYQVITTSVWFHSIEPKKWRENFPPFKFH